MIKTFKANSLISYHKRIAAELTVFNSFFNSKVGYS